MNRDPNKLVLDNIP